MFVAHFGAAHEFAHFLGRQGTRVAVEVDADFGLGGRAYWSHEFLLKYVSSELSGGEYRGFKKDVQ